MIRATQSTFLVTAEPERHAAMGTEFIDESIAPLTIAERHEPFGQELHAHRRTIIVRELFGQQRRRPVAAEHVAHRRPRTRSGKKLILVCSQHLWSPGC